jgi:hypothetical protein
MLNFLKKIYYTKYVKKSYSISAVDLVIDRIFRNKKKGVYIDIGCNHPIKYNNTYLLHKRGWNGINVDLDKKSIQEFNRLRENDTNIQALISDKAEIMDVYFYHERSAINTVSKNLANYRKKKYKLIKKASITLNSIIKNSNYKKKKIDFLSIDVENHEFNVLKNFNFKKYKIDIIVCENTDLSQNNLETQDINIKKIFKSKLYKLMTDNKYKLINIVNSDLVFYRKKNDKRYRIYN